MPLANAFLRSPAEFAEEPSFPLDVFLCADCALVQLLDVIDPELLFRDYIYVTGTSDTIAAHNREYASTVVDRFGLGRGDLVVEVASNDGSLLRRFQETGVRTLGIEPATNIADMARNSGIDTVNEFFNEAVGAQIRRDHGPAKVVIGNNVLAHVDDTPDFLSGCREVISDDAIVIIEVPYLGELVERLEYDTIYHEHLCYFSVSALMRLFERVGLTIMEIERVPVHGGSLRLYAGFRERRPDHADSVKELEESEDDAGLKDLEHFREFAARVEENRSSLRELLASLANGRRLAAYGAPAKGNTLLNYCGIGTDTFAFAVDKSPLKQGLYTPGTHIPVVDTGELLRRRPAYTVILAWNFADEIMKQQVAYREGGGQFVLPIPDPCVVG